MKICNIIDFDVYLYLLIKCLTFSVSPVNRNNKKNKIKPIKQRAKIQWRGKTKKNTSQYLHYAIGNDLLGVTDNGHNDEDGVAVVVEQMSITPGATLS